jgi:D-alanyl-D-alanine carboxypeptidase
VGVAISIASSYRSVARQAEIIATKLAHGTSIDDILRSVAPPGFSEHHTGRAIDIVSPDHPDLDVSFAYTPAYEWLTINAGFFGFTLSYPEGNGSGYQYEPWHWCFQMPSV